MYSYVGPSFISSLFYFIYFTSVLHFNSFLHFYVGPSFIGKAEHNAPVPKEKKKVKSDVFRNNGKIFITTMACLNTNTNTNTNTNANSNTNTKKYKYKCKQGTLTCLNAKLCQTARRNVVQVQPIV